MSSIPCPFHGTASIPTARVGDVDMESEWSFLQEIYRDSLVETRQRELIEARLAGLPAPLTSEELRWAGRIAWRNHARCIGRLHWRSLIVRDHRSIDTPEAMAGSLLQHLALAQEGGLARPHMTVFAPAGSGERGPRIWNSQLCGYAGYLEKDGTVLGDPANRQITAWALELGWQPPSSPSAFDLLPWLISGPDGRVRVFPLPPGSVMEVHLRHPRYKWLERLGLRWYAVPIVSSFCFHAAATDYTAAPFNGWYMGTEIGARNLGDVDRYNLLPLVAEQLGLDRGAKRSLWQDHAMLALNEAVLHSYAADGVKLVDHHTASDEFVQFCAREMKRGRQVSARWDWIVPPMSGSATKVFHQPMSEFPTTPDFRAQPTASGHPYVASSA